MQAIWKILDYFFLLRPTLFFPLWTVVLAGRYNSNSEEPLAVVFILFGMLLGASYVLNQIADIEGDRDNNKLFLLADKYISRKSALTLVACLSIAGVCFFFTLNLVFGFLSILFLFVTGYFYNFPPFRLKDNPYFGPLVTVFGGASAFLFGALPDFNLALLAKTLPYLFAYSAVALLTAIPDREGDEKAGKRTFSIAHGQQLTILIAAMFCLFSALLASITRDTLIFWPALLSLPVFIYSALNPGEVKYVVLSIKFSILSLSLAAGLFFPWYFALIAGYYFFARWYYRKRFNVEYPSFKLKES